MRFGNRKYSGGRRQGGDGHFQSVVLSQMLTKRQLASLGMGVVFAAALISILASGNPPLPFQRGQVAQSDIEARVSFAVVDDEATRTAREAAGASAPSVYRLDRAPFNRMQENLKNALTAMSSAATYEDIPAATAQALGITRDLYDTLTSARGEWEKGSAASAATEVFDLLIKNGCLSDADIRLEQKRTKADGITILAGQTRRFVPLSSVTRPEDLKATFKRELSRQMGTAVAASVITDYVEPALKPFLFYDEAESAAARKATIEASAEVKADFDRGDVLVRRDTLIDTFQIKVLESEQAMYASTMPARDRMVRLLGMTITVIFLVWLFGAYVARYEPRVLKKPIRMIVLMALAVGLAAIARVFVWSSLSWHLVPVALFAMAVAVAYNPLFGVGYALFLAVLVGIATGADFALAISLLLGSMAGVLVIGRVRSRTTPLLAGLAAGAGTFLATWGTGLLFHAEHVYARTLADSTYGLLNGLACGTLITVFLPFIERMFKVMTELSLLELVDLNKPLLRRLALEAPGSYNHSLVVGNMADAAAEVIGANRLLARAGGYYHDIGKLSKPDYFVENRGTVASRHYNLSPTMSTLIIISHVKDGAEIAKDFSIPTPIADIVREHHGTTLVEYFYREAIEQADDATKVSDESFRYPGPKPRTKEAAIVMLADGVESASRTVTEPTPAKLEHLVSDIARVKVEDGQFDECRLTMAEIKQIEVSLTKSLAGIFHSRIKYPGREL